MDGKKKRNKHLFCKNQRAKVGATSFEDVFLIILLHLPSFCLSGIGVGICGKDHIRKSKRNNPNPSISKVDRDEKINNLGININIADIDKMDGRINNLSTDIDKIDIDRRVDNPDRNTNIADIKKKADDSGISIDKIDIDKKADNPSTSTNIVDIDVDRKTNLGININTVDIDMDRGADNVGTEIADADEEVDDPSIDIGTTDADIQAAASNKTCMSLFFLCKALFLSLLLN